MLQTSKRNMAHVADTCQLADVDPTVIADGSNGSLPSRSFQKISQQTLIEYAQRPFLCWLLACETENKEYRKIIGKKIIA